MVCLRCSREIFIRNLGFQNYFTEESLSAFMGRRHFHIERRDFMGEPTKYKINPLQIVFLWHPDDAKKVNPIIDYARKMLSPDANHPFSHSIHLPIRLCTSLTEHIPAFRPDIRHAQQTLVFAFVSDSIIASSTYGKDRNWYDFIKNNFIENDNVIKGNPIKFIGIALSGTAYKLDRTNNFIRISDYEKNPDILVMQLFIAIAHQIYRYGLESKALKLFLSHTKADRLGIELAKSIKCYVDEHSDMLNFYDVTSIEPGAKFWHRIEDAMPDSTFIAIRTDHYADSYWCQKEVLEAKKQARPILEVDALCSMEDRSFPFLQNIPVLRVSVDFKESDPKSDECTLLNILAMSLVETIRYHLFLHQYPSVGSDITLARPPELYDIYRLSAKGGMSVLYPYPDLYSDEYAILKKQDIKLSTPYTRELAYLQRMKIGISISDFPKESMLSYGIDQNVQELLMSEMAGFFLGHKATLIYGGDLRDNGFTKYLQNEVKILQDRFKTDEIFCRNYFAWPIYLSTNQATKSWRASCVGILDIQEVEPPIDIQSQSECFHDIFRPDTPERAYLWARSLTHMRKKLISECDIRITACGKWAGYSGLMPGILEEVLIAIEQERPVYLLGGFGGITQKICQAVESSADDKIAFPEELTFLWQKNHVAGYELLKNEYAKNDRPFAPYESLGDILTFDSLNNGLSNEENMQLFHSVSFDEAIQLILNGLEHISKL